MSPRIAAPSNVTATWMPHTTLSQTSQVCLIIRSAHVTLDPLEHQSPQEWQIRVQVCAIGGVELISCVPSRTAAAPVEARKAGDARHPSVMSATHDCWWDYFIQLPLRWRDLPRDAYFSFNVIGEGDVMLFSATLSLFDTYGKLRTKLQKVELENPDMADHNQNSGVSSIMEPRHKKYLEDGDPVWKASTVLDQLQRFQQAPTKSDRKFGDLPSVPWLDTLTRERCQEELADISAIYDEAHAWVDNSGPVLVVELPCFEIPVIFEETFYSTPLDGACGGVTPLELAEYRRQTKEQEAGGETVDFDALELVQFVDYENENDNPVEDKYRALAHDLLRGMVDPALKPDRSQRERLEAIISSPSYHPTREEKDLLWKFRFSLVDNRRALTKFLLAVDWTVDSEVVQAAELLEQWRKRSPIQVSDALKLLGKHVAFQTSLVRSYAIETLSAAPDSELRLYLLQLVQALRYEATDLAGPMAHESSLAAFLINRAAGNIELANYFYWYLKVELENQTHGAKYKEIFIALRQKLTQTPFMPFTLHDVGFSASHKIKNIVGSVSTKIGTSLRGSEGSHDKESHIIAKRTMWDVLVAQDDFITGILALQAKCRLSRGKKDAKEDQLRTMLATEGVDKVDHHEGVPLPSAPYVFVDSVVPHTAIIFKSALYPAVLQFRTVATTKNDSSIQSLTSVIVKTGDDLRQDQLIIMMIQLMDGLLKRSALELCLTPYSILATSPHSGLVEFIGHAHPISQVLANNNGSILQFFQNEAPHKDAKYGIRPEVMSHYVRSCAGYCVITYLLGVGDRHLDNILLRTSGHFFHIDFGFIFGRDPKPLPPAFRLTREMVEGMGGMDSTEYRQFCSLACQAYNALRKSAGLILNLLHLMTDAGIQDLSNNPAADAEGVIAKVEERFRLHLTDEQAETYFKALINDCLGAIAPRVMDVFHNFSVARR